MPRHHVTFLFRWVFLSPTNCLFLNCETEKMIFFFSYPDLYTYYYVYSSNWLCAMFFGFLLRRFLREIAGLDPAPTFVREHKARCAMSWWRIYLWPLSHWFPSYCTLLLPDVVLHLAILLGSVHMIGFESWIDLCHTDRFRKIK